MSDTAAGMAGTPGLRSVRAALSAAAVWVVIEFVVRTAGAVLVLLSLKPSAWMPGEQVELRFGWNVGLAALSTLMLGAVFYRRIRREDLRWAGLGYRFDAAVAVSGVASGAVLLGSLLLVGKIDAHLFGLADADGPAKGIAAAGMPVALAFLVDNGVVSPAIEEFVWRGCIQRRLIAGWGARLGIVVTALLFAAKHIVVDLSLIRTTTLLAASVGLGVIGYQWGTWASTLAHITMNTSATLYDLIAAWR